MLRNLRDLLTAPCSERLLIDFEPKRHEVAEDDNIIQYNEHLTYPSNPEEQTRHLERMRGTTNTVLQSRKLIGGHFGNISVERKFLKWDEWCRRDLGLDSVALGLCPMVDCCEDRNE